MSEFKNYRRKGASQMRNVEHAECRGFHTSPIFKGFLLKNTLISQNIEISISEADRKNGSPKMGDMIARNPKNHEDQWLVAKAYFNDNLEPIEINDFVADVSNCAFDAILNDFRQWQAKWDLYNNKKTLKKPESSDDFIVKTESKYVIKMKKSLGNTTSNGATKNVKDIVFWGNGDLFKLIGKASSKNEGWMKSTKAMEIEGVGCVVQITTQQNNQVAEAVTFVPLVKIQETKENNEVIARKLVCI